MDSYLLQEVRNYIWHLSRHRHMWSSHVPVAPQKIKKIKKIKGCTCSCYGKSYPVHPKPSEKESHDESRSPAIWLDCKDWIVWQTFCVIILNKSLYTEHFGLNLERLCLELRCDSAILIHVSTLCHCSELWLVTFLLLLWILKHLLVVLTK